jgi:hypothetical protein
MPGMTILSFQAYYKKAVKPQFGPALDKTLKMFIIVAIYK